MSVSVVIPTYNRARRLSAAIASVLRQGIGDLDIIVVDDGSTDDTREVVATFGRGVKYVYQPNQGGGAARNTGIRHATGEFVAFIDSDDRWEDYKLDVQLALLRCEPGIGLVFSDFVIETPSGTVPGGASLWAGRALDFPEMTRVELPHSSGTRPAAWPQASITCWTGGMYRQLLDELPILTSSVVVRRSVLDDTTWYAEDVVLFEDWEFFARVARKAAVGFVAAPAAVNVGHKDPGRISKCSALDRALSYLGLLERVWLPDQEFMDRHGRAARSAHGRALLAVAREALLAGRRNDAQAALETWARLGVRERRGWAIVYRACAGIGSGQAVLRNVLRGRAVARLVLPVRKRAYGTVNPAA